MCSDTDIFGLTKNRQDSLQKKPQRTDFLANGSLHRRSVLVHALSQVFC